MEISGSQMSGFEVPSPPRERQVAIADYLDRETAQIDTLIGKQEELIATLRERRAASVTAASSETERSVRIRRVVTRIRQGWSPNCESIPADGLTEWGVLKVGCSNTGQFDAQENKRLPAEESPRPEHAIEVGEIVLSRSNTRELVGLPAVVETSYPRLLLSDLTYGLTVSSEVVPPYVALAMRSHKTRSDVAAAAKGTSPSMQKLSQSDVLNLVIPFPPLHEQRAIVARLDAETAKIDALIAKAEQFIALSKERRAALITAAVTGQLDIAA
jgi:type I restriction enzyme S subunit